MMDEFDVEYSQVFLISGLFTGCMSIGSLFLVLVKWFGYRPVGMVASFLYSMSLLAASQSNSVFMLILCCGGLAGFMCGVSINLIFLTFSVYYEKHRSKAAGLTASAPSLGILAAAPALSALIDEFGWRGALLIASGFSLHACVGTSLYRAVVKKEAIYAKVKKYDETEVEPLPETNCSNRLQSILDFSVFSKPVYLLCYVASMCYWSALVGCLFLIIPYGMETLGLNRHDASILVTAQSGGDFVGQLLGGFIGDVKGINSAILLGTTSALSTLATYAITLCKGYTSVIAVAFLIGLIYAPFGGLFILLYSTVFTPDKMTNAVSYGGFLATSLVLPTTYALGLIIDTTGDVSKAYYVCGGLMCICATAIFGIYLLKRVAKD